MNEMLSQMERFEGVFIASTNLMDDLDDAAMRRFDLKIFLDYLGQNQALKLFAAHCKTLGLGALPDTLCNEVAKLHPVTPGDFANAARQHRFRAFPHPRAFMDAVAKECDGKAKRVGKRMVF